MITIEERVPLAPFTTWRVGGVADRLIRTDEPDQLGATLAALDPAEPLLWMGRGSNLLIRDGGFRGTVVLLDPPTDGVVLQPRQCIRATAGVPLSRLVRRARRQQWYGLDFLAGIPGSVGGALAMNAGAFGEETWGRVVEVETIDRKGQLFTLTPEAYRIGYRLVEPLQGGERWFVAATFFAAADPTTGSEKYRQQLERRNRTQPMAKCSCGSVFRNPPNDYAGRLIESIGLKGYAMGRVAVSDRHANFIVHDGDATATEIERLMGWLQQQVKQRCGVDLQPEVRVVGEPLYQSLQSG